MLSFGPFRLIGAERLLLKDGAPVAVGGRALDILIALTDRAGEVVSARELIERVWPDIFVEEANLRVHISALRKVLGEGKGGSRYIVNVTGRGYTFVAPTQRAVTPVAAISSRPRNLPAPPQFLVGRAATIDTLSSLLLSRRFVSVVGPGGIGKTTVAVAVAHAVHREFGEDAVCFVDLSSLTGPTGFVSTVASALGCVVQGPDPELSIRAFLADKRVLIVLDSCEHVIEAVASLCERLFQEVPSLHLLTTSREALRVDGDTVHFLAPLDGPPDDTSSAEQALTWPAVQLFMERASSSGYYAPLSDSDAPIVADICRRLDGIALAIELVASRVSTFGIRGTADLLDSGAELFLQGRRGASLRHQTLHAMLDWSFRLLDAGEQTILCALSVFAGPFTLSAAQAVVSDDEKTAVAAAIANLTAKSLIRASSTGGATYYRLLDTTRAYAGAKLNESGEEEKVAKRHARYYTSLLKAPSDQCWVTDDSEINPHVAQLSNIRSALEWSFSPSGDLAGGVELAAHAAGLFLRMSLLEECQQWCRRAMAAMRDSDRGTLIEVELQEGLAMSSMYTRGNTDEAMAAFEHGLELSKRLLHKGHQVALLSGLNLFLTRRGDISGALAVAEKSAAVARELHLSNQSAMTAWVLAAAHNIAGDQASAIQQCELAARLASHSKQGPIDLFRLHGIATYARALWLAGFPDRGVKTARQAIYEMQDINHPVTRSIVLIYSVPVLFWNGDLEEAATCNERAIAHTLKYSLAPHHAVALASKGELVLAQGNLESGIKILREALKALDANRYHLVSFPTRRALAEGLARDGRLGEALDTINRVVMDAERVGSTQWPPDLLRAQGEILLAQPRPDIPAAEDCLLRSINVAAKQSALSWELKAAIPLARMWREQGKADDARATLQGVYRRFTEGFETKALVTARRLLDELGAAT